MSALRLVKREFRPGRAWYSLVRLDDDRVAMGGLRSEGEAEAWAIEAGHTLVNPPAKKSEGVDRQGATPAGPVETTPSGPSTEGVRPALPRPAVRPAPSVARLTKEQASCCAATVDDYGRFCIGFCSPECERRPARRSA